MKPCIWQKYIPFNLFTLVEKCFYFQPWKIFHSFDIDAPDWRKKSQHGACGYMSVLFIDALTLQTSLFESHRKKFNWLYSVHLDLDEPLLQDPVTDGQRLSLEHFLEDIRLFETLLDFPFKRLAEMLAILLFLLCLWIRQRGLLFARAFLVRSYQLFVWTRLLDDRL